MIYKIKSSHFTFNFSYYHSFCIYFIPNLFNSNLQILYLVDFSFFFMFLGVKLMIHSFYGSWNYYFNFIINLMIINIE